MPRTRKYSGPLMRGQSSVKAKPKKAMPKTIAAVAKSGLNKLEKKQVSAIIKKKAESKYFKTGVITPAQGLKLQTNVADSSQIEVLGLAVGKHEQEQVIGTYGYASVGGAASTNISLNVFRTFQGATINVDGTITAGDEQKFASFIPEGRKVSPSFTQTKIRIHRQSINTNSDDKAEMSVPYYYRVIRVKPKKNKYTDVDFDPNLDLFQDNFGEAYGIYSGGDAYRNTFSRFELMSSKINSRRYEVMNDMHFVLLPPTSTSNGFENFDGRLVSQISRGSDKMITFNHKAPKMLYYDGKYNETDSCQPLAGNNEELIFIHGCFLGSDSPNINMQHKVDIKVVSTFKDV